MGLIAICSWSCGRLAAARQPTSVVFVCPYGSAKSVVAARFFNRMAEEHGLSVRAVARGIEPEATIPQYVREPIQQDGFQIGADEKPMPIDVNEIRNASAVVCIKCELPKKYAAMARRSLEWHDVPDVDAGYVPARDKIVSHLREFMLQLSESKNKQRR
jgi:protein-tyrosine-phosphatase